MGVLVVCMCFTLLHSVVEFNWHTGDNPSSVDHRGRAQGEALIAWSARLCRNGSTTPRHPSIASSISDGLFHLKLHSVPFMSASSLHLKLHFGAIPAVKAAGRGLDGSSVQLFQVSRGYSVSQRRHRLSHLFGDSAHALFNRLVSFLQAHGARTGVAHVRLDEAEWGEKVILAARPLRRRPRRAGGRGMTHPGCIAKEFSQRFSKAIRRTR